MSSYAELMAQAKALMEQAESVRKAELANVVAEIKAKMKEFGITIADLGGVMTRLPQVLVNVRGGGLTGQADAIKQGAARALCDLSPDNRKPLKIEGHLSRDPRAKERRKYGLKKARKAPQFSKR